MRHSIRMMMLAAMTAGSSALAVPFTAPQALPDASLPAWTTGSIVTSHLAPATLGTTRGVAAASPELDRLSFLDPVGTPGRVIDADLRGGSAVVVIDVEGDGDQDIVAASRWRRELYLYRNTGDGSFETRVTLATELDTPIALIAADMDGDSCKDVIGITDHDRRLFRLRGSATGLQPMEILFNAPAPLRALTAADLDGDGDEDLVLAHGNQVLTLKSQGIGSPVISATLDFEASLLQLRDLNGDSRPELIACHRHSGGLRLFPGQAGATWGTGIELQSAARAMGNADLDGDGDADLLIAAHDTGELRWLENRGAFSFTTARPASGARATTIVTADQSGDGHADVMLTDPADAAVSLLASLAGRPYERWATDFAFGNKAGPDDDADGDGEANVIAYALGSDPLDAKPEGGAIRQSGPDFFFEFSRRVSPMPLGLTYVVKTSGDLNHWEIPSAVEVSVEPLSPGWERVQVRLNGSGETARFARVLIHYQDP